MKKMTKYNFSADNNFSFALRDYFDQMTHKTKNKNVKILPVTTYNITPPLIVTVLMVSAEIIKKLTHKHLHIVSVMVYQPRSYQ